MTTSDFRMDGRVALVTGGSRGLGFAMARAFAGAGAQVAIVARRRGPIEEAVAAIEKGAGRQRVMSATYQTQTISPTRLPKSSRATTRSMS